MLPITKKNKNQIKLQQYKKSQKHFAKDKINRKVIDQCHFTSKHKGEAHSISNLRFNVSNVIHVVFHNRSDYVYHFIIRRINKAV